MSHRTLTDQQFRDVHDTIVVLLAVAGDASVAFDTRVGDVLRRGYDAVRGENEPPFAVLPYHKGQGRIALPQGLRAQIQDEFLKAPAPGGAL